MAPLCLYQQFTVGLLHRVGVLVDLRNKVSHQITHDCKQSTPHIGANLVDALVPGEQRVGVLAFEQQQALGLVDGRFQTTLGDHSGRHLRIEVINALSQS
jgi:hypothetical protein